MTREENREKFNWFIFMIGYFTAGYLFINWISSRRVGFFDVSFGVDLQIPFVPVFIFGYILVYLSVLLTYFVIQNMEDWYRTVVTFLLATTVAYVIFLAFPVRMTMRPNLEAVSGFSAYVTRLYYLIDLPFNCFPSLHVTYPTIATLVVWRHHHIMRYVFLAMTLIVAASVVIVKQHYVADVIGGFINAGLCFYVAVRLEALWRGWFCCKIPAIEK